jgi:hypothetical protein
VTIERVFLATERMFWRLAHSIVFSQSADAPSAPEPTVMPAD